MGAMPTKQSPLLCELHAHTTWSDGALTPRELCDAYGRFGFDVLAITDHTTADGFVQDASFPFYLAELEREAERARRLYDLLVIPGLELTDDDPDPRRAAHAVAVGLRSFVGVADGIENAVRLARTRGAALVAAHPYELDDLRAADRPTAAFACEPARWAPLVDRFELFNRHTLFGWVAAAGLPRSRPATSTSRPTSRRGRRCSRRRRTSAPWSSTCARRGRRTSSGSSPRLRGRPARPNRRASSRACRRSSPSSRRAPRGERLAVRRPRDRRTVAGIGRHRDRVREVARAERDAACGRAERDAVDPDARLLRRERRLRRRRRAAVLGAVGLEHDRGREEVPGHAPDALAAERVGGEGRRRCEPVAEARPGLRPGACRARRSRPRGPSSAASATSAVLLNVTIPTWTPFGSRSTNVRIAATVAARRVGRTSVAAIEPETSTRSTTARVFGAAAARPPPVLAPRTSEPPPSTPYAAAPAASAARASANVRNRRRRRCARASSKRASGSSSRGGRGGAVTVTVTSPSTMKLV